MRGAGRSLLHGQHIPNYGTFPQNGQNLPNLQLNAPVLNLAQVPIQNPNLNLNHNPLPVPIQIPNQDQHPIVPNLNQDVVPNLNQDDNPNPVQDIVPNPNQDDNPNPVQDIVPNPNQDDNPNPVQDLVPNPNQNDNPNPVQDIVPNPNQDDNPNPNDQIPPNLVNQNPPVHMQNPNPPQGGGGNLLDSPLANFISINSPGTQTGVVGGASGVNSLLTPPSQLPGSSRIPPKMGTATTGIGAGLNVLGMGSDLVASAQGINNMRREGGIRGFFRGLRDTFSFRRGETGQKAETRSTAKRLAVDLPVNLADASSQGMQGANAISSLVHGGTSALSPVLGVASAGIGTGVQGIVAGRAAWRMGRAWHHKRAVDRVRRGFSARNNVHQDVSDAADHMSKQLGKRRKRNIIGGLGAAAGAAGGGLLLAGLLGGAAMLTPIGWALAGAGALTAAGLGAYKLYRHFKKKKEDRLGSERKTHADNLHAAYQRGGQDRTDAMAVLGSHGITHDHMQGDPEKSKQLIRRKLEGW